MLMSRAGRFLLTIWAFWLGAALTESGNFVACPMHGAAASAMESHAKAHAGHEHSSRQNDSHQCSCLGECCSTAPASVAKAPTIALGAIVDPAVVAPEAPRAFEPSPVPHRLPFANGPPAIVS
jgi:hypothetical protein